MQDNREKYVNGTITAGQWQILITKWVGAVCTQISTKPENIVRGFEKCGISVRIDGLSDDLININRLPNYRVRPDLTVEAQMTIFLIWTPQMMT